MSSEAERDAASPVARITVAKDSTGIRVQSAGRYEFVDCFDFFEPRIQLDQRIWPIPTASISSFDLVANVVGANGRKRAREPLVIVY